MPDHVSRKRGRLNEIDFINPFHVRRLWPTQWRRLIVCLTVPDGPNGSSFRKTFKLAFPEAHNLHFHDSRGTAATRFHAAGFSNREIGEIMAWEEGHVDKIIRRYISQSARTAAIIQKFNQSERGT